LVYPHVTPWNKLIPDIAHGEGGVISKPHKGRGEDIFAIREYLPGDTSRDIHWRSTAKHSQAMVKEYEMPGIKKVHIVLDTSMTRKITPSELNSFEERVSKAASLAYHLLKQQDCFVGLSVGNEFIPPRKGDSHLHRMLRALALVAPQHEIQKQLPSPPPDAVVVRVKEKR
jgi:uncharacterized protein (DUF58 family)